MLRRFAVDSAVEWWDLVIPFIPHSLIIHHRTSTGCYLSGQCLVVWPSHRSIYKYLDTGLPSLSVTKFESVKLTSHAQHASRWRMRASQTCRLLCLCCQLAALWLDAKMTQYYVALEFMLGNSGTKLPAQCMLGRRGEFEGLADWLSMLPLWAVPIDYNIGLAHLSVCLSVAKVERHRITKIGVNACRGRSIRRTIFQCTHCMGWLKLWC